MSPAFPFIWFAGGAAYSFDVYKKFMHVEPREVQDQNNVRWQCIQAFAGVKTSVTEKAADHAQGNDDTVTVVCTPSGGSQTVRLDLAQDWNKTMSDEALLQAINSATQLNRQ